MKRSSEHRARVQMRATRARLELQAVYQISGFPPMPAQVLEVSRTGVQLCIEREIELGTPVEIAFDPGVAADPRGCKPTAVKVRGRVVRLAASTPSTFVYGIALDIDEEAAATLQWLALLLYASTPS